MVSGPAGRVRVFPICFLGWDQPFKSRRRSVGAGSSCGDRTWEDSEPREALPADSAQTSLGHEWGGMVGRDRW